MPLVLYSTNTWLSYIIAQKYYGEVHYAWCTPDFHMNNQNVIDSTTPPTSTPYEILNSLKVEVSRGDRHSAKIKENKVGIKKGASFKKSIGIITDVQEQEIFEIVDQSEIRDFRPLLYVLPFDNCAHLLKAVPIKDRAHPMSVEFIIEELPRNLFDVIEL